LIYFLWRRR